VDTRIQQNVLLAPLTTLRIGGPASYFIEAASERDLLNALDFATTKSLPLFILGGGSNLLVSDTGFPGLVLHIGLQGLQLENSADRVLVKAAAGEDWDGVVALAVERGLAGIECLSGIPGSTGGAPVQNVGAYGQETADVLVSVRAFDRRAQKIVELSHADCGFSYRTSIFNSSEKDRYIVLDVTLALSPGGQPTIRYPDVRRRFESVDGPPSLADVRQAVREIRAGKAMLLTADDPDCRSAGSFFKNPIISEADYARLQSSIAETVPRYPAPNGRVKTAAAWLIERAGFSKGYRLGGAALSRKHTLALVNTGNATAADIIRLAGEIRARVEDRFGIRLVPEPVFVGFEEQF
jgi:UDP-N-acetylmuramate dehydrogenase